MGLTSEDPVSPNGGRHTQFKVQKWLVDGCGRSKVNWLIILIHKLGMPIHQPG